MSLKIQNKGFTLVEVMVALLIMSAGVVGVVSLQSNLLRSEQSIDLRQFALQLGRAKFDDLASFIDVEDKVGQFDYNDIGNNVGGTLAAGNVNVQVSAKAGHLHTFNRSWQITDQYYVDTTGDGNQDSWVASTSASAPSPLPTTPAQKQVSVVVAWTDLDGSAKQININGSLAPIPPGRSFQAMNESDNAKQGAVVGYTPGKAPDVISYDLGNNEKIETSKPVPDILNNGGNTVVTFETVRYYQDASGTDKLEQEDFVTLNCECKLAGIGQGKTPAMTVLQGGKLVTELGRFVSKMTGIPANNKQEPLCTSCCRDHHDTQKMITDEVQFRAEANAPHKHYKINSSGILTLATSISDEYNEICRFKRVDGLFEIYPDWELVDIVEFSDQYLFSSSVLDDYVDYSEETVQASITGATPPSKASDRDRDVVPGGYQYIARGLYVDRLKSAHKTEIKNRIANGNSTWKAITPFYDVNLTLLANWSTTNTTIADVTQETIQSIVDPTQNYYGTYSRGRLQAIKDGVVDLRVMAYAGNAGIIGGEPISTVTKLQTKMDDGVEITVDSKAASEKFFGLTGNIACLITINGVTDSCETNNAKKAGYVDLSNLSIIETPSRFTCNVTVPKGRATPFYGCQNVSENWSGTIDFSITIPQATVVISVQYPDGSVNNAGRLNLPAGLSGTSTNEYNVVINVTK